MSEPKNFFKNFDIPKKHKGFKFSYSNKVNTIKVFQDSRDIQFNPRFTAQLNGYQKYYMVTWAIKFHKTKNFEKATIQAINDYFNNGLPKDDFDKIKFILRKYNSTYQTIINFLKNLFQNGKQSLF